MPALRSALQLGLLGLSGLTIVLLAASFGACASAPSSAPPAQPSPVASMVPLAPSSPAPVVAASVEVPTPVAPPKPLPGCPEDLPAAQAVHSYDEAQAAIKRAGEHPTTKDLATLLPLLRSAALSGHVKAQLRYGSYVFGFWMTDEMFWPKDKLNAVTALAMLRVVARRDPRSSTQWYGGLGSDPPDLRQEPLKNLPKAWVELAVQEAQAWERCHPEPAPIP